MKCDFCDLPAIAMVGESNEILVCRLHGRSEHPAVRLYDSVDYSVAAQYWYESAIESAKEANILKDELRELRKHWIVRLIERYK